MNFRVGVGVAIGLSVRGQRRNYSAEKAIGADRGDEDVPQRCRTSGTKRRIEISCVFDRRSDTNRGRNVRRVRGEAVLECKSVICAVRAHVLACEWR